MADVAFVARIDEKISRAPIAAWRKHGLANIDNIFHVEFEGVIEDANNE